MYAHRLLKKLPDKVPHSTCGLAQLAHTEKERKRLQDFQQGWAPDNFTQTMGVSAE